MLLIPENIRLGLINNVGYGQLWYCLMLAAYWACVLYLFALIFARGQAYYLCKADVMVNVTLHFLNTYDFIPDLDHFNYQNSFFAILLEFRHFLEHSLGLMNKLLTGLDLSKSSTLLDFYKGSNIPALFESIKSLLAYAAAGYPQNLVDVCSYDYHGYVCSKVGEAFNQMQGMFLRSLEQKLIIGPDLSREFDELLVNYQIIYLSILATGRANAFPEELTIIQSYLSNWYENKIAPYGAGLATYKPLKMLPNQPRRPTLPKLQNPPREGDWEHDFRHGEWVVVDDSHPIPPGFIIVPGPTKNPES